MDAWLAHAAGWIFFGTVLFSILATGFVRLIATRMGVVDQPDPKGRKQHTRPTPLMGGLGLYVAFAVAVLFAVGFAPGFLDGSSLKLKHVLGFLIGGLILVVGGAIDDRKNLSPRIQILFPMLAALAVILSGVGVTFLSNPFGRAIDLTGITVPILSWHGTPYFVVLFADVFAFLWILASVYATKFLDGMDGLVSGTAVIGGVVLFALSLKPEVDQPRTAYLALVLAAACLGFLVWNVPLPSARIFLGEGGSTFLGFALAVLAIISGAKLATALLLLGLPLADMIFVIIRRMIARKSPFVGDRRHIHFQLLSVYRGSVPKVLITIWSVVLTFGLLALFLSGRAKAIALLSALLFALLLAVFALRRARPS